MANFKYKFPYLARQINGPLAKVYGEAFDSVYERDQAFIDFLAAFDIENLHGEWLDMLGTVLGFSRPYITIPELQYAFRFDDLPKILPANSHGFSNDPIHTFNNDGGVLDDTERDRNYYELEDERYQKYLRAIVRAKATLSIASIADVMDTFVHPTRYAISFITENDIKISLPFTYEVNEEYLEQAFDSIFTTSPRVTVTAESDFDTVYTVPEITRVVHEITNSNDFTVTYQFQDLKSVFTVTLDSSLASYEQDVTDALEEIYGEDADVEIVVVVGP